MAEELYLIIGAIILLLAMYDFFFTTLSGSGAAFITRFISSLSHKLLQFIVGLIGRKGYSISGMLINLMVLFTWVILVWLGLFMMYSSDPEAIINSKGQVADFFERLYFTGYTLSTLGMGNFKPVTPFFEILTSCFSFFGFIFFTTSMTYLISLSSAVILKRSLALSINTLGKNPNEVVEQLINKDISFSTQKFTSLEEMINRHSVNHQAYPVIHYYSNPDLASSISINFAKLDEALSILLFTDRGKKLQLELIPLRNSMTHFLKHMEQKYSPTINTGNDSGFNLPQFDSEQNEQDKSDFSVQHRRKILEGLLNGESFEWKDVYSSEK